MYVVYIVNAYVGVFFLYSCFYFVAAFGNRWKRRHPEDFLFEAALLRCVRIFVCVCTCFFFL